MLNLAVFLDQGARFWPNREAVVFGDTRLTYAQLLAAASQVANGLVKLGLKPGDHVALSCPNVPWFPIACYGVFLAGGAVVPLNVLCKRREIAFNLDDSDARFFLCFEGNASLPMAEEGAAGFSEVDTCEHLVIITADPAAPNPAADIKESLTLGQLMHGQSPTIEYVPRKPEDIAILLYTSGTTGTPKAAELTHANLVINATEIRRLLKFTPEERILAVLPLFHSFGMTVVMNAGFSAGGTIVLHPRFEPGPVLDVMAREKVTTFCGVPTMYWALLQQKPERIEPARDALRLCISGGAALPLEVLRGFEKAFDVPILEGYGLSETSPVACFNLLEIERKPGSIGIPLYGVHMRVVDEAGADVPTGEIGEVIIRGYNVMNGYYKKPEATAKVMRDGWFHTGDVGKIDEDGYFYIVDRTKDMIIRGGFNVYPREVEETLATHPAVNLCAVVGIPHKSHGEEVKAFVLPNEGVECSEKELVAWCKENMASYKYPRQVEFRDALPMSATGKILKRELREG